MDSKPTKYSILALAMMALGMAHDGPGGQDDRRDRRDDRDDYRIRHVGEYDQTLDHRWGDRDHRRGQDDKTIDITVVLPQPQTQPPQPPRPQPRPPVQPPPQNHGDFGRDGNRWQWINGQWRLNN